MGRYQAVQEQRPSRFHFAFLHSARTVSHRVADRFAASNKVIRYLLRAELIALHGAGNYPGAQLYMVMVPLYMSSVPQG